MIVKLKDIQFHSDIIVKKAKLELLSGNLTALIGESGSGKSTIIDSIIFENEFLESFMYQDKDYAKATKEERRVLERAGLSIHDMDVIELNEAFAAQALGVLRELGLPDDAPHVNPNGGAIALGHPLGMSGARLALAASHELHRRNGRYALCTMCIGVGQGIAMILERV